MSAHIVLLFEPPRASNRAELSIADELEKAGYEVIEAHSLSMAATLLFVSPALEAVVIDAAGDQVAAKLADSVSAIRPGLPLLRARQAQKREQMGKPSTKGAQLYRLLMDFLNRDA